MHRVSGNESTASRVGAVVDSEVAVDVQDSCRTARCKDSRCEVKGIAVRVILA